ncbi:zinc knuckle-domain-containing protein [Hypoxylon trugodes]|uniref:zinc knuckle-domain-containing protein n=1 Tax=Hypoxylon trugodes TaxID=326681 RepID=UPI00219FB40D|nr:zinc knuckle-domain-containing protein [Hypoxylon trugodes]KAI1389481.1 zinc knuckle-domain-containing protein [Hypoxylon trugodes]
MYRRGPPKSTPANVQCQKCLKRGHYSYECKASAQERPYVSRPSRTQQLFNPKLVPKLDSDVQETLQKQKGIADEELAKREAERAKKRDLEQNGTDDESPRRRRSRSASYDSVSSISTRRSASPPPQHSSTAHSNIRRRDDPSPPPASHGSRGRSFSPGSDYDRRYSPSPQRPARTGSPSDGPGRISRSRTRNLSPAKGGYDSRDEAPSRRRRYSSSASRSPPPQHQRRYRSRSPGEPKRRGRSPPRRGGRGGRRGGAPPRQQRERSLSPFSKRLALTQAMSRGG